jgi:hypothetical protein
MSALVYPKFIGRLGNNLFEIAACIGYAKKYGVKWGIKKGYVEQGFQANQVDRFMPDLPYCGGNYRRYSEHQRGWDNDWFNYHEIPFFPEGVELVGFFQSEKYFENAKEEVLDTFRPYVRWREDLKGVCSIHVRRGDYVQHAGSFPPIGIQYLAQAMQVMIDKGVTKFMVCSDDMDWCIQNILLVGPYSGYEIEYHIGTDEWDDFSTLASCDHHIIANSTFSWWNAYLGRNPNKVVITPSAETWFGPDGGVKHPVYDLIPEGWIQIHTR